MEITSPIPADRERPAQALWQPAYDLYAYEPLVQEWVLDRLFEQLQRTQIIRVRIEAVSLDSTTEGSSGRLWRVKKRPSIH